MSKSTQFTKLDTLRAHLAIARLHNDEAAIEEYTSKIVNMQYYKVLKKTTIIEQIEIRADSEEEAKQIATTDDYVIKWNQLGKSSTYKINEVK